MHLRVEATQSCALFPTKPTFVNPPAPPPSTLGYQPLSNTHPYSHQYYPHHQQQPQQGYTYSSGFNSSNSSNSSSSNSNVKRSSSAFEPLFYQQPRQQQQHILPPSPPATPTSTIDQLPNLADFAASIVYLMWHARKPSLVANSKASSPYRHSFSTVSGNASPAFKRFCLQVLTATQLSESAVFLALKYIANLLESNPSIEGAEGSEYRLFIVALMLANKFLDDNTFTNKTWSEVSGMKVQDLNIMESEFLEALEYSLFVREENYTQWKSVLNNCRRRLNQQQHSLMMMSPAEQQHPLQRQEWITSTLYDLGLYKSSGEEKSVDVQHPQHDYIETDDDDDDDDDDVDDEEELFQMMHQQHTLRQQQDEQQRAMWSAAASATRVQLEQSQRQYQLYLMQQEQQQQQQQQYRHHQSMTTPPLSLSSSSSTSALNRSGRSSVSSFASRHMSDTIPSSFALPTSRSTTSTNRAAPSYLQSGSGYGSSSSYRSSSSAYRSTCAPPGFQRRSSPWEPLTGTGGGGGGRCGDSFYSHQPFHPYQRQVTIVPPPSLRSHCPWGE